MCNGTPGPNPHLLITVPLFTVAIVLDGIRLVFQPPQSPELQSAEHLWAFVD